MNQLQVENAVVQHRGGTHAKLNAELAVVVLQIGLPDFPAFDGVATQRAFTHKRPHVFAISHRRRRCGIPFITAGGLIPLCDNLLPELLAAGIDRDQQ